MRSELESTTKPENVIRVSDVSSSPTPGMWKGIANDSRERTNVPRDRKESPIRGPRRKCCEEEMISCR